LSRELNPWFVWYQLLHGYSRGNTDAFQRATTNIRNLQVPRYLAGTYLVVPPLAEQARIVGAVDELLHSVNAGVSTLQKVRRNLVRMRASVLQSAITGILFGDDRPISGPAGLPQSWRMVTVADVAEVSGGITKNPRRKPRNNPIPFLRVANVPRDSLDLSEIHEIEVYDGELERLRLKSGDLLVVEGNGSPDQIGRSALWHGEIDPCVHQNHLIRVRPGAEILPDYLNLYWNAPSSMALIQAAATSTSGLHTLSTGKVRSVPVSLPPISTQARIVAEVKRQLSYADRLASDVAAVDGRASRLRTAVLSAAFAGLLFPRTSATSMR
jgi:type I restriction enzyme S subunit